MSDIVTGEAEAVAAPNTPLKAGSPPSIAPPDLTSPLPKAKRVGPQKLAVVMVGLPARGKTYIARKLAYYLNWVQVSTKVFNLGQYRRALLGAQSPAVFFHPDNTEARELRRQLAVKAMDDMFSWFEAGGLVGILDATNSTRNRRALVHDLCTERGYSVIFVESVCENLQQIENNILNVKVKLPDYKEVRVEDAISDFKARIEYYRAKYQELCLTADKDYSFMKLIDVNRAFTVNRLKGYLPMRIVRYLSNVHLKTRAIYMTRHGESEYNTLHRIGGDSMLSPRGEIYAERLKQFMEKEGFGDELMVWTSTLIRTQQTAAHFEGVQSWKALDELDAGECDGMTYKDVEEKYPELYRLREAQKYSTRYLRGESYQDAVNRVEPRILELERQEDPILVVCHQAVARCLLAYFQHLENLPEELPYLKIPLHTVIKVTPTAMGCNVDRIYLGPECVDTHRPRLDVKLP